MLLLLLKKRISIASRLVVATSIEMIGSAATGVNIMVMIVAGIIKAAIAVATVGVFFDCFDHRSVNSVENCKNPVKPRVNSDALSAVIEETSVSNSR